MLYTPHIHTILDSEAKIIIIIAISYKNFCLIKIKELSRKTFIHIINNINLQIVCFVHTHTQKYNNYNNNYDNVIKKFDTII